MKYVNDNQIIEEAATQMIESHLQWSNSLDGKKPSDNDGARGEILYALFDYHATQADGWDNVTEGEKEEIKAKAAELFNAAAEIADKKWDAARVLLGI